MWERWNKYYVTQPYHDLSYACDETRQEVMKARAKRKDRRLMTAFIVMVVSFAVMVLSGLLQFVIGLALGAMVFIGVFAYGVIQLLTFRPRLCCAHCGRTMEVAWGPVRDERSGEYLICPACHTYVFTYRTLR
ncbi:MAG TPA: hypothetical protein VMZ92_12110 [Planctomycetota bacterium]|nr:hypothetical protein [Planctomycetota bacterium]